MPDTLYKYNKANFHIYNRSFNFLFTSISINVLAVEEKHYFYSFTNTFMNDEENDIRMKIPEIKSCSVFKKR